MHICETFYKKIVEFILQTFVRNILYDIRPDLHLVCLGKKMSPKKTCLYYCMKDKYSMWVEIQVTESSKSATFASPRSALSLTPPRKDILKSKIASPCALFSNQSQGKPFPQQVSRWINAQMCCKVTESRSKHEITQLVLSKSLNTLRETEVEGTLDQSIFIQERIHLSKIVRVTSSPFDVII